MLFSTCWFSILWHFWDFIRMNMESELIFDCGGHYDYLLALRFLILIWIIHVLKFSRFQVLNRIVFLPLHSNNFICWNDFMSFLRRFLSCYFILIYNFNYLRCKLVRSVSIITHPSVRLFLFFKKIVLSYSVNNVIWGLYIVRPIRLISRIVARNNLSAVILF